jgi:hypothetical protein
MRRKLTVALGAALAAAGLMVLACDSEPPRPVTRPPLFVRPDGTGEFVTIQAAADADKDGDLIELDDGTFRGVGNRDIDFRGKDITVRSRCWDPAACVINCEADSLDPHRGFYFHSGETAQARVEGLPITGGHTRGANLANAGGAILCHNNASPTIQPCRFLNNTARGMGGGMHRETTGAWWRCTPQVRSCVFSGNSRGSGAGIAAWAAARLIEDCTVVGNRVTSAGGAIDLSAILGNARVIRTIVAFNSGAWGVVISAGNEDGTVSCSDIFGNERGDWIGSLDSLRATAMETSVLTHSS